MRSYHNAVIQKQRVPFVLVIFVLFFFLIVGRLVHLQIVRHSYYTKIASVQHWIKDTIPAKRGKIFAKDSLGNTPYLLATNQTLSLVFAEPPKVEKKEEAVNFLAETLSMDKKDISEKLSQKTQYAAIKHRLSKEEADKIAKKKLKGVGLSDEHWRYYPEGSLASSLLGFVNAEQVGNYGLEEYFNDELNGTPGTLKQEADDKGIKIAFGNNVSKAPVDGEDLYLTIDRYIQGEAEKQLSESVNKFGAAGGQVIVIDPATGAILAMANNPVFDPNKYDKIKQDNYAVFKNKAVVDTYEPGSVFKVITLASGLDANKILPETKFEDTGSINLNGYKIMNSDKKAHGMCTMTYVLENSLNTGSTWVQQKLGKDLFYDYVRKFGFGELSGIELPGEVSGRVYDPKELNDHGYATMSFGQSISSTPLQMLNSFAVIANGGKMMKPYVVEKITDNKKRNDQTQPKGVRRVISEKAAQDMTKMMVSVVENGHGYQAKVAGYKVAGKTGTAQVPKKEGGGYEASKNIGTFIGFAPADEPKFVVLAKIDEPKGIPWAESSAAPIVGKMLDYLLKYYQIPPTEKVK